MRPLSLIWEMLYRRQGIEKRRGWIRICRERDSHQVVAHVAVVVEEAGSLVVVTFTLPQQTRQIDHLPKQNWPGNRTCNPKNTATLFVVIGSIGCVTYNVVNTFKISQLNMIIQTIIK